MDELKKERRGVWRNIFSTFGSIFSSKAEASEIDDKELAKELAEIRKQEGNGIKDLEQGLEKSHENVKEATKVKTPKIKLEKTQTIQKPVKTVKREEKELDER